MDNFVPDIYQKSIYDINYKKLKKNGIKYILMDLNNTMASYETDYPTDKLKEKMYELSKMFKVIIVSNSGKDRIRPFKEVLNLDSAYKAHKPFKRKLKKVMNMFNMKDTEVVMIGDSIICDIYAGNKMGFTTILVNSMSYERPFLEKVCLHYEKKIIKKLNKKGILLKGEYYE